MRISQIIITILLFNSVYLIEFGYAWTFRDNYCIIVPMAICGISFFVISIQKLFHMAVHENRKFEMGIEKSAHLQCEHNECCSFPHVKFDINSLRDDLRHRVYGQHLASKEIVSALLKHQDNLEDLTVTKPLVLSLHGGPGTGKHYVVDLMVKHLFMMGESSQYVHRFDGRVDFPNATKNDIHREMIRLKVYRSLRSCERAMIIFDYVHELPEVVIESISALLEHLARMGGSAYQRATIVLISNTGADQIRHLLEQNMSRRLLREKTDLEYFREALESNAYIGGEDTQRKQLIPPEFIDAYIPFLPLEPKHVEKCIAAEYRRERKFATKGETTLVLNKYFAFDGLFVRNGCKDVKKNVDKALHRSEF